MPYSYRDLIVGVLRDLDEPDHHHPTVDQILQACADVGQQLHNQLQNTSIGWNVKSVPLPVPNGTGRYIITAGDFGKALRLVVRSTESGWVGERQIDIVDRQNLLAFQSGSYSFTQNDAFGDWYTDSVAVLEYDNGVPFIEMFPDLSLGNAELRLTYEVGEIPTATTEDTFLPQASSFHPYARMLISLRALPFATWSTIVEPGTTREQKQAEWRKRRAELQQSLAAFVVEGKSDWDDWITTNRQTGSTRARSYGDWYENSPYGDAYLSGNSG